MITEKYPFILPILLIWVVFFIVVLLVFYTKIGQRGLPILNRRFIMRFVSISLFVLFLSILISGISQLFGVSKIIGGKSTVYWHALAGYLFLLFAILHLTNHIKDIYRYIYKNSLKKKVSEDDQASIGLDKN